MEYYSSSDNINITPQENSTSAFSIASMICGVIAILACCAGILSLPFGALSILFAALSKRRGKNMPGMSITGIWLGCVGILLGILMTVYSFFMVFNDPMVYDQVNATYEMLYGESFDEFLERYSIQ